MRAPQDIKRLQRLVEPPWWTFSLKERSSEYAALQLWKSGPAGVPFLVKTLKKKSGAAHQAVLAASQHIGPDDKDALPALVLALKEHPVSEICEAIGRMGLAAQPAVPALIEMLPEVDLSTQLEIVGALGSMGMASLQGLRRIVRTEKLHWQVRKRAIEIFGSLGPKARGVADSLLLALQDPHSQVRHAAACALEALDIHTVADVVASVRRSRLKRVGLGSEELRRLFLVKKFHSSRVDEIIEAVHALSFHRGASDSTWERMEVLLAPNPEEVGTEAESKLSTELLVHGLLTERDEQARRAYVKELGRRRESWLEPLLKHLTEDKSLSESLRYYCQEVAEWI